MALLNFPAMLWWTVVRSRIRLTLADNTLMAKCALLVVSILAHYDIDWARLIAEQIHEATLKRSSSVPSLCLIYRLHLEWRVESLHQLVDAQRTLDASLIKA